MTISAKKAVAIAKGRQIKQQSGPSLKCNRIPSIGRIQARFALLVVMMAALVFTGATARAMTVGFFTGAGGLGDDAFTDSAYSGLRKAQQIHGFRLIVEEPGPSGRVTDHKAEPIISQSDVLVMLGTQHSQLAAKYARLYPGKRFFNFDDPIAPLPNLVSIIFKQHEGSFLAGALAGWVTSTKKVAFIGGTDFNVIHAFRVGFLEGVRYAAPDVEVLETFVTRGSDASGFTNPKKAFKIADAWYHQGVDIIYAAAGPSGMGVIHAAKANSRLAIGVDTDQDHMAKGFVLTSMLKRLDLAIFQELTLLIEGHFTPGVKYYGLKEGGVGLTSMTYTRHLVPDTVLKKLATVEQAILAGKIKVTDYMNSATENRKEKHP